MEEPGEVPYNSGMRLNVLIQKLAESGCVWVDTELRALVLLAPDGVYTFRPNKVSRRLLAKFKSNVERLTGEKLPAGVLGLHFILSTLVAESMGSIPNAPC